MFEILVSPAVEFLKRLDVWWKDRSERNLSALRSAFEQEVAQVFASVERIHKDYTLNLVQLRQKLENHSVPSKEVIDWIEMQGLAYRHERDALYAYEDQVFSASSLPIDPTSGKAEALAYSTREFLRSVSKYLWSATGHNDLSFYRDFSQELTAIWKCHQLTGEAPSVCFEGEVIADMCTALREATDVALPRAWTEVVIKFKSARQALLALK